MHGQVLVMKWKNGQNVFHLSIKNEVVQFFQVESRSNVVVFFVVFFFLFFFSYLVLKMMTSIVKCKNDYIYISNDGGKMYVFPHTFVSTLL